MVRTSNRTRTLRETREALVRAYIAGRQSLWDLEEEEDNEDGMDVDNSSSSSSSSSDSSSSWTDTSSSSSDSNDMSLAPLSINSDGTIGDIEVMQAIIGGLESRRVLHERRTPRGMERLCDRLVRLKNSDIPSDHQFYRHLVRMKPEAFEAIVTLLSNHDNFIVSDPRRAGASVTEQAAVAFYWMGRCGNGGGVVDVSFACGCAEGSVFKWTAAVCEALYDLRAQVLCWASEPEKEAAKAWVARRSGCERFGDGFTMVDGSLVPLAFKPSKKAHPTEYFDRKGQYSLNIQLVVLPNTMRIVDYVVGFKGSAQDSRAWAASDLVKRPGVYLSDDEFIWTDGGYGLSYFTCGPYDHIVAAKSRDFRRFNYAVSNVRVRSEHAFGYLKGRFQCLRGLRQLVRDEFDHQRLSVTVIGALVAHNLALRWDGNEERATFLDLIALSPEAVAAWREIESLSPEAEQFEQDAWARRMTRYRARVEEDRARHQTMSQHGRDLERRQAGKQLREELHNALFAAQDLDFEDTTEQSRLHDKTEVEYRAWRARQTDAAEARRRAR
ncbi:hypothetical protein CF326_g9307, partial [Tilletia indica]